MTHFVPVAPANVAQVAAWFVAPMLHHAHVYEVVHALQCRCVLYVQLIMADMTLVLITTIHLVKTVIMVTKMCLG